MTADTKTCFLQYAKTILSQKGTKKAVESRGPLVEFTKSNPRTVERWIYQGIMPVGTPLLKLRFFLEIMGYNPSEIIELKQKSALLYNLGEVIAFDCLEDIEVAQMLGFGRTDSLHRVLLRSFNTSSAKTLIIEKIVDRHNNAARKARAEWVNRLNPGLPAKEKSFPENEIVLKQNPMADKNSRRRDIQSLAYLVMGMLSLAERVSSDEFTAEDRRELRQLAGGDGIFKLSNSLNRLCGENAREISILKQIASNKKEETR